MALTGGTAGKMLQGSLELDDLLQEKEVPLATKLTAAGRG